MSERQQWVPTSWGQAYDNGYSAGRADALDSGVSGLLDELGRYRRALATIGRKGEPLSSYAARAIARKALDRTGPLCQVRLEVPSSSHHTRPAA